jgi:hypothetical protein
LLSAGGTIALVAPSFRVNRSAPGDAAVWTAVVVFVFAAIVRLGWPSLLPPGRGPDLTHHLLLVDYIEQQGHLVHDRSLEGAMGEMAHYTPGAHLLAVIGGRLFDTGGWRAFFPLLTLAAALTAGFVFLIARRLQLSVPYAISAVLLLFLPAQYFHGAFTHDSFLAQTIATCFAAAAWWSLVVWDEERTAISAVAFAIFLAAVFLSWPVFVGPIILVFLALVMGDSPDPWRKRISMLVIGLLPLCAIAAVHLPGRLGWLAIVRASGAVLQPSLESVGWVLPLLALLGIFISIGNRRVRTTIVLLLAIVLQAIALFVLAKTRGADTPYMALKMVYLAIYPAAVLAAAGLAWLARAVLARSGSREARSAVGWLIATALLLMAVRPALSAPRAVPVISLDLYDAGRWTRAHIGRSCVDYLVADAETAYWLHLAVLGNPRVSERMVEVDRYDPRTAPGPWIARTGRPFAIVELRRLPGEIRSRVEIVREFGTAAVIRNPDVMMGDCDLGR